MTIPDDAPEDRPEDCEVEYTTDPAWDELIWGVAAERPEVRLPGAGARAEVEGWRITAVGNRPVDHMGRDLLLASLWRDERPRLFHEMSNDPPGWLSDLVPKNQPHRRPATQLRVLHYLHAAHLGRMAAALRAEATPAGSPEWGLLARLGRCVPYGAAFEPARAAPECRPCGLVWLCPWCYARRAVALYRRIKAGPLARPAGKYLIHAWAAHDGSLLGSDPSWVGDCPVAAAPDGYHLPGREKVLALRAFAWDRLRERAWRIGATGGLVTHQVGPWVTSPRRRGVPSGLATFKHYFGLLAEVTFGGDYGPADFAYDTEYNAGRHAYLDLNHEDIYPTGERMFFYWSGHPAASGRVDALRLFLAGSSMSYPVSNLDWFCGGLNSPVARGRRVRGAFAGQPHFMMDPVQWWSYAAATRGLGTYAPFGSWKDALAERVAGDGGVDVTDLTRTLPRRQAAARRRKPLGEENARRRDEADDATRRLLDVARPLFEQVRREPRVGRGRPNHRSRLREALREAGHEVTENDMKRLMRLLHE